PPPLYEYRPLVRGYVEERARALWARDDARLALEDLRREPAAAIFARAHAGPKPSEDEALFHSVLLPLIVATAEACGGFDWKDDAFERAYAELEGSLFRGRHAYAAIAPLVGVSLGTQVELGERLFEAEADPELGEALDRWELSLFQSEPFRAEQVRESLTALLGGADGLWAASLRCSVLLGENGRERADLHRALQGGSPEP